MTAPTTTNPFTQGSKSPSLKFPAVGTTHTLNVTAAPEFKQSKNFETQQPEFWPDGSPKKIILVQGKVNGEDFALWVTPGTALFAAIVAAQQTAGAEIGPGGTLTVSYTHDTPSSKGAHFAPAKQYAASYSPPSAFTKAADPFAKASGPVNGAAPAASPAPAASSAPSNTAPPAPGGLTAEQRAALVAAGVDMSTFV